MTKKQIITLVGVVVVIAAIVFFGLLQKGGRLAERGELRPKATGGGEVAKQSGLESQGYKPDVPKNATLTTPKGEAPASSNPNLNTKIRIFDLKATQKGFEPASFTVNKGDQVQFDFTAVDGDYDLAIPYLGVQFYPVKKGETRRLPFDVGGLPGTFIFQCRDYCPAGKTIKGELIVLP